MKKLAIILLIILIIPFKLYAADVFLDVSKVIRKTGILVPDFIGQDNSEETDALARKITDITRNDLVFSGIFSVKQGTLYQNRELGDLGALGIDAVLKGQFRIEGENLIIECYVFDVAKTQQIMGKIFKGKKSNLRALVHQLSDEVTYNFTGTQGIAHTKIAFAAAVKGGHKEIYVVDYDGYNLQKLTNDRSITLLPRWLPNGQSLVYTSYQKFNPDLYVFDFKTYTSRLFSYFQGLNVSASYSPDGNYIAITLSKDGNPEVYLMKANGSLRSRLTYSLGADTSAAWAPNGRQITFTSDRSGTPQIYIMDKEGTNLRRLTYMGSYNDSSCWSPRGDMIAYVSRMGGIFEIYTMASDGSNIQRLTQQAGSNENPSFSPDGQYIVFTSTRSGQSELYIMRADGSNQRKLFPEEMSSVIQGDCFTPSWGP
jgi:TolB protein